MGQWFLRLGFPVQPVQVRSPWELDPITDANKVENIKQRQCLTKFNKANKKWSRKRNLKERQEKEGEVTSPGAGAGGASSPASVVLLAEASSPP